MFTCCRREKLVAWTRDRSAWKIARVSGSMLRIALTVGLIPRSRVPYAAGTSCTAPYVRWCWSHSRFPWALDLARIPFSSNYHSYIPQEALLNLLFLAYCWCLIFGELFEPFYQLIILKPPMTLSFTNLTNHDFIGGLSDSDWHSTEVRQTLLWSDGERFNPANCHQLLVKRWVNCPPCPSSQKKSIYNFAKNLIPVIGHFESLSPWVSSYFHGRSTHPFSSDHNQCSLCAQAQRVKWVKD